MLWQFFSLPGIENGIEYRYFSRYRIEVRNSSIVTTLQLDKTIYILLFSYFDSALCFKWLYIIYINIDEGWLSVLNLCIQIVEVDVLPSWPTRLVKD